MAKLMQRGGVSIFHTPGCSIVSLSYLMSVSYWNNTVQNILTAHTYTLKDINETIHVVCSGSEKCLRLEEGFQHHCLF